MEVKILCCEKNYLEIEINNLTIAEFLRNALWEDKSVELAAWKRDHPSKNPILVLKTNNKEAKKVLLDTIEKIQKFNDEFIKEFKKTVK